MKNPRRRTDYEGKLVRLIREAGFYAVRVPASGGHDPNAIGDVSMCYNKTFVAIEVKTTNKDFLYCSKIRPDARKMVKLSRRYKAPCIFAIRFIHRTEGGWRFVKPVDVLRHKKILRHELFRKASELEQNLQKILNL